MNYEIQSHEPNPFFAVSVNNQVWLFNSIDKIVSQYHYLNALCDDPVYIHSIKDDSTFTVLIQSSLGEHSESFNKYQDALAYYSQCIEFGFYPSLSVQF